MIVRILLIFFVLTFYVNLPELKAQQGKISGKVMNEKTGEPLIGATVTIQGKTKATQTDQNGNYTISGLAEGEYSIKCSYVSYNTRIIDGLKVKVGEVVVQDILMEAKSSGKEIVIKAPGSGKPKETINSILVAQKNSASVSDGISAESIKKTPDRNTGDILKRVSGASLQEDKFAVVRGLNDRYNSAYINGASLPSSESDRKAFAFDIFPANMLDNLIIYKTATPDMPAEFAGGQIVINTKGIPTENFNSLSIGLGYNTIATFQNKKVYEGGKLDFLGIDTKRKLNEAIPDIRAYKQLNQNDQIKYAKLFPTKDWGYTNSIATPNINFQYILGRNIERKGKEFFGMTLALTYTRNNNRNFGDRIFYDAETLSPQRVYEEETFSTQTLLGAIANFSFKLNNNNTLSLKNIYSVNSDNRIITRQGQDDRINEQNLFTRSYALWFTENKIFSTQLNGEHYIVKPKIKVNWLASVSDIRRDVPALRRMVYDSISGAAAYEAKLENILPVDNDNTAGLSFYSKTREQLNNYKLDISRSFKALNLTLKSGAFYQARSRTFNPRLLAFHSFNNAKLDRSLLSQSPDIIFSSNNMGNLKSGKTGFSLKDITEIRDEYTASTELTAYYGMADQRIGKWLRLIYGLRVESFQQILNAEESAIKPIRVNTFQTDLLPSANIIFSLNAKQNIRLCYSKTVNRPEFRELAPFLFRDYTIRYAVFGDTSLRRALIENFDFRYECFPGKGQMFSLSTFYKKFKDPIELIASFTQARTLTYRNTPSATLLGIELELRANIGIVTKAADRSLLNNFSIFSNLTFIQSKVDLKATDVSNFYYKRGRVMQGQSPYVINAGISYQDDKSNVTSTLSLNRYGQRIFLASNGVATSSGQLEEPDLWENGRTQIDFQITKSFPKKGIDFKLNIKDILAQQLIFFEDSNSNNKYDKGTDLLRSSANFGRVISVSLTFKL